MDYPQSLQAVILRLLSDSNVDHRVGRGVHYFPEAVKAHLGGQVANALISETCWALLGQGLLYIDLTQPAPENWCWMLTAAGRTAAADEEASPEDPTGYMARLRAKVPDVSSIVATYASEALMSYTSRCYLASATMLGVASEAVFLETAEAFVDWLHEGRERNAIRDVLGKPGAAYVHKFQEFRRRLESHKGELPRDLADGMTLTMDAVLDLLRVYRNDAGHPSGKHISRDDQFTHLQLFLRYLEKLYDLRRFFREGRTPTH